MNIQERDNSSQPQPNVESENAIILGQPSKYELHNIQLRYKLAPITIKTLCKLPGAPDRRQVLHTVCLASEFRSFPLKMTDKGFFREVNDHTAIPYPIKESPTQPWHKVFLLVQIDLLRTGWPNKISAAGRKDLYQERGRIYLLLDRVLRCLIDIIGLRQDGRGINVALDVLRSVKSGVWEGAGKELLLVEGIGAVKMEKLIQAGVTSIQKLAKLDFYHIERLLSRNPPFGHQVLHQLAGFPQLCCKFETIAQHCPDPQSPGEGSRTKDTEIPIWVSRVILGYKNEQLPIWKKTNPWVTLVLEGEDGRLVWFWHGCLTELTDEKELILGLEVKRSENIRVRLACEDTVGTIVEHFHKIP